MSLHITRGITAKEVANLLCVSESSVWRYVKLFHMTGSVSPADCRHGPQKVLSEFEQLTVVQSLLNKPNMYLSEVCDDLFEATGREVHPSTIFRTVHQFGMTRQKLQRIALQRSEELRGEFMAEISFLDPNIC